ncbi:MAG: hypothetical protein PVJ11_12815 [Syntrophobacterales bacterium]|jgi:hypothetical protein
MKKLGIVLLAMVFIFGLATQAGADVQEVQRSPVFDGDEPFTFENLPLGEPIVDQIDGVVFSKGLYADDFLSIFLGIPFAANSLDLTNYYQEPEPVVTANFMETVTRVGFDILAPSNDGGLSEIVVTVYRDGLETGEVKHYTSSNTFIGVQDPLGIDAVAISADGSYGLHPNNVFLIDNFVFGGVPDTGPAEIEVIMNVKPPNCTGASINMKSQGVTPVVIVGTADLDVTMIVLSSIELQGAAPVRSAVEDVANCESPELDGHPDLILKFDTQEVVRGMQASQKAGDTLENDDWPLLRLTGSLSDGTLIYADQVVSVKGKAEKESRGKQKGKK